jgi:putative oxidoreductase
VETPIPRSGVGQSPAYDRASTERLRAAERAERAVTLLASSEGVTVGPVFLRIALGAIFFAHGAQKLFGIWGGYGWEGTLRYFESQLQIPPALGGVVILLELLGGLALIFGALTRIASILLAIEMVVATSLVHFPHGFFLNWGNEPGRGHGIEFNLALIGGLLMLAIEGPGSFSFDGWLVSSARKRVAVERERLEHRRVPLPAAGQSPPDRSAGGL